MTKARSLTRDQVVDVVGNIVDQWFAERIANGHIARHTPAYNQAQGAKDNLKDRLIAALAKEEAPAKPAEPAEVAETAQEGRVELAQD